MLPIKNFSLNQISRQTLLISSSVTRTFFTKDLLRFYLLDACGGLIEAVNGTITSPSFPDLYPANKNCIWEVLAPPQWKITVNFTHFDIEGNNVRDFYPIYFYFSISYLWSDTKFNSNFS